MTERRPRVVAEAIELERRCRRLVAAIARLRPELAAPLERATADLARSLAPGELTSVSGRARVRAALLAVRHVRTHLRIAAAAGLVAETDAADGRARVDRIEAALRLYGTRRAA